MKNRKPLVAILMGSDSDFPAMEEAAKILTEFQVPYEITVSSAHRSPDRTAEFARRAERRGVEVIIAGAGGAAHLAGVIAAHTILPVIGVPMESGFMGLDSLLSTVQMPGGIPVATVAIGKAGAKNAAYLAGQILALSDAAIATRLREDREANVRHVQSKDAELQAKLKGSQSH